MPKTLMPASANGPTSEARTPTVENGIGPANLKQRQSRSHRTTSGTTAWSQTMDSSSVVRVIEKNGPAVAQAGTAASGSSWQTAKMPGSKLRLRGVISSPERTGDHARPESPGRFHVTAIVVPEPFDQLLLLLLGANYEEKKGHRTHQEDEPVRRHQGVCQHRQGEGHVERMANPAVGGVRHQRMFLPRYHGVGDVLAQVAKGPHQEQSSQDAQADAYPAH